MGELTKSTESSTLLVKVSDILNSEFGGLIERILGDTEEEKDIIGSWIEDEKTIFLDRVSRTEEWFNDNLAMKVRAKRTVIMMVGKIIVKKAQMDRVKFDEAEYIRIMRENDLEIERNIKNIRPQKSDIKITDAQPDMIDPDSNYPSDYTQSGT